MENYSIAYDFKIFVIRGLIHPRIINSDVAYNYLIILSLYTYHKLIILIQSLLFSSQTTPICNLYISDPILPTDGNSALQRRAFRTFQSISPREIIEIVYPKKQSRNFKRETGTNLGNTHPMRADLEYNRI